MAENVAKVVFVGDTRVGKTSIINRYARKNEQTVPTIGANSISFSVPLDTETITLSVWDTAGQEEFKCLVPMYARGAQVAVVVFDLSNKETYDGLHSWIESVKEDYEIPNIIVVGNKNDLETFEKPEEIEIKYKDEILTYIPTSAETGSGIDNLFMQIAIDSQKTQETYKPSTTFSQKTNIDEKKGGCC